MRLTKQNMLSDASNEILQRSVEKDFVGWRKTKFKFKKFKFQKYCDK